MLATDHEEPKPPPGLEADILERVLFIAHSVWLLVGRFMVYEGLTLNEGRVLLLMLRWPDAGHSPSDLARATTLARNTISVALCRLQGKDLVEHLGSSHEDRRFLRYRLTHGGETVAREAQAQLDTMGRAVFARFSNEERQDIAKYLVRIDGHAREEALLAEWHAPRVIRRRGKQRRLPFRYRKPTT